MNEEGEMVENFPTIGKEAWKVSMMILSFGDHCTMMIIYDQI